MVRYPASYQVVQVIYDLLIGTDWGLQRDDEFRGNNSPKGDPFTRAAVDRWSGIPKSSKYQLTKAKTNAEDKLTLLIVLLV